MDIVRVGVIGSGFIGDAHAEAFKLVPDAKVVAVASPTPGKAKDFAARHRIQHAFEDYRDLLAVKDIDIVTLGIPNDLHAEVTIMAARMGKHVVCEKPLCVTLEQADAMIEACQRANVLLMYAEELVFSPKYVRAKMLIDEGALGRVFAVKQSEEHFGPHSAWFWDVNRSGGGTLMDMGCHSVEYGRWVLGKPPVKSVFASLGTYVHGDKTQGEDHSFCIIEYENSAVCLAENSWAKRGGVDDRGEIYGDQGFTLIDLSRGSSLLTYSQVGYGYAVEKADITTGYTFTMYEELWNSGIPQEMQHFVRCVRGLEKPMETGEDGREVLKILYAAYQSAGEGRRIDWPYDPPNVNKPIDLWKRC
jgi:myo-inositol 2-dehydrogenase / D-chiro-inositol 1-dehydrogenase